MVMQLQLSKENFNQTLSQFSTSELENLIEKFPYFQQAHLLLAKKYQQQSNPKFDQQLQLAALYTQDRELLFSIFNEKEIAIHVSVQELTEEINAQAFSDIHDIEEQPVIEEVKAETTEPVLEAQQPEVELNVEAKAEEVVEQKVDLISMESESVIHAEPLLKETGKEFSASEPHTFDEWLKAYSQTERPKIAFVPEEIPAEVEKQDEELEKLYLTNIPVNLQELVEEETNYSKGLDKFIEEQIQKHKAPTVRMPVYENELAPELITETMAKVYEMQKKYAKAIRCYEILGLKYPEKNDFFAARINYLKNII
jgi:hypothetical protein